MSFNWSTYLELANILIEERKEDLEEAYLRSSISRSYYGVFCIARNLLLKKGQSIPKTDVHKFVINRYKSSTTLTEKQIGSFLDHLRRDRNDADYAEYKHISVNMARQSYFKALQVLKQLKTIEGR